jgi:hypothetical protein
MKNFFLVLLAALTLLTGCQTAGQYDPVKTEQVRAAIEPIAAGAVRRIVLKDPAKAEATGNYFRQVGAVFCEMKASGNFSPETLIASLQGIQRPDNQDIADAIAVMVALYRIQWGNRFKAELPPDKWPYQIASFFCDAIDQGLRDAGQAGAK